MTSDLIFSTLTLAVVALAFGNIIAGIGCRVGA